MKDFEFLTKNDHFVCVDDLTNHPIYQGYCYRYIVKLDGKMYHRLNIIIKKKKETLVFVKELGTMEDETFESAGLVINPEVHKTPIWFQDLLNKAMHKINPRFYMD